jgi:hypothetical protein
MNTPFFRCIVGSCLLVAASVLLATSAHAQGMNPTFVVDRLDSLVHLNSAQRAAAIDIVTRQNSALQNLAPGRDRAIKGMPIRQAARWQIRGLLTPDQQALYDITPQMNGGGAMFDPAARVERLNKLVNLSTDQAAAATAVFDRLLQAIGSIPPTENVMANVTANQDARAAIRAILTPAQQHIYDISPQMEGGGATVNPANRASDLDRTVALTDAQINQVAAIYQKQVEELAALSPEDRIGPKAMPINQATRAAIRAVLTPEQQAKLDANPNLLPDMEERTYVTSAIKSSAALAARLGAIARVTIGNTSVMSSNEQVLHGEYHFRVVGATGSVSLTVQWQRSPSTGAITIVKVTGDDGSAVQL